MRAFCTVSAPLEVCAPPARPLSPGARFLALKLLGTPQPQTLYFLVEAKSRVREVYTQTCLHFSKQGMIDTELFGLAVFADGDFLFADPESKLSKYGPKSWRSSHTHGLDANGRPLLELHFRVQFYIESPLMLRDEVSRNYYYLQLKTNAVHRESPKECSEQFHILLGGLALQAELGDAPSKEEITGLSGVVEHQTSTSTSTNTTTDYFRSEDFLPASVRTPWGCPAIASCHRKYRGMSRADAETHYIREACTLYDAINAHIYRMKLNKNDISPGSILLIIYAKGIKILAENGQTATTFLWPSITKLSFERKKFEIRSGEHKITLYSLSDEKNKMLLALCRETHQFSMKIAPRLVEAIKKEEDDMSSIHTHCLYSRSMNIPYHKNKNEQRISVISSTSSNTTSGIISDRVQSEDELEIMINSPPVAPIAAPSTESLALAHLLDRPCISRHSSSADELTTTHLKSASSAIKCKQSAAGTDEPDSSPISHQLFGSQCSSSCSTVVVTNGDVNNRKDVKSTSIPEFSSHTAQSSSLSEIGSNSVGHPEDDDNCMSGVYTLDHTAPLTETSGVYTMNSSEMTGQSSEIAESVSESHESSHYGCFQPNMPIMSNIKSENTSDLNATNASFRHRLDSVDLADQFRLRSDSTVSAAGSFRGDGSDPTDKKHGLLSAEELTDLIVGRGTYPNRKTVSDNLDSDCDYVTLPLPLEGDSYIQGHQDTAPTEDEFEDELMSQPPAPPKRIDSVQHSTLSDLAKRSPPPYNARHETTGLCGPPIKAEDEVAPVLEQIPEVPLRNQPSYAQPLTSHRYSSPAKPTNAVKPANLVLEEATARFIKSKPNINILKAHTSVVGEKPSFAAPTIQHLPNAPVHSICNTIGIPLMPYKIHAAHKSMSALSPPHPAYLDAKSTPRTCVLLPVIKPRQYLPPPPPSMPRQPPPPPPPPQLATVYTSQLARSQIELYQQQLYSDVDYVIYPIQDPAVSQQEYLDAKQGSILAAMAAHNSRPSPGPYLNAYHHPGVSTSAKTHAVYRSTPYLPIPMTVSMSSRYASAQNLSDTYVQLPGAYSPMYSPSVTSLCSSYCEPPPPMPPFRPNSMRPNTFSRSRSDDNILNSIETMPRSKRLPPPPPPPPYETKKILKPPLPTPVEEHSLNIQPPPVPQKTFSMPLNAEVKRDDRKISTVTSSPKTSQTSNSVSSLDIQSLREKSRHLDLPLIAALCNDRSLLKQTNAFVVPKHHIRNMSQFTTSPSTTSTTNGVPKLMPTMGTSGLKHKYPVSGLNTMQLAKPRKSIASHRHPNDKLPPLPSQMGGTVIKQTAEGNNYVIDPIKHKSYNSQPNV